MEDALDHPDFPEFLHVMAELNSAEEREDQFWDRMSQWFQIGQLEKENLDFELGMFFTDVKAINIKLHRLEEKLPKPFKENFIINNKLLNAHGRICEVE